MIKNNKKIIVITSIIIGIILITCGIMSVNNKKSADKEKIVETKKENEIENENEIKNETKVDDNETKNEVNNEKENVVIEEPEQKVSDIPSIYEGFNVSGKIIIPKTGVDLYVFDKQTVKGMEIAACILYSTSDLNEIGNTVITGHNYRNGKLFSNNGKLEIGDKIYIKDVEGKELEYTVYDTFMTTPEDASFYMRVCDAPEITLSTCSDDEESRIITLARCEN